jgi:hypothetical protein
MFEQFLGCSVCHRLPLVAPAGLHKCSHPLDLDRRWLDWLMAPAEPRRAVRSAAVRPPSRRRFSVRSWDAARAAAVERAFAEVPLYREQWATAGRRLPEPTPIDAAALADELFRLAPMAAPYEPSQETWPLAGTRGALRDALRVAGVLSRRTPVLELRRELVEWTSLARTGPRYAPLLASDAPVSAPTVREDLLAAGARMAAAAGRAIVVGEPSELEAVAAAIPSAVAVHRLTLRDAAPSDASPAVLHEPGVGYLGARRPDCRCFHVDHRRCHLRVDADGALVTRLDSRRPTLVDVRVPGSGFNRVEPCPRHGTPVLRA